MGTPRGGQRDAAASAQAQPKQGSKHRQRPGYLQSAGGDGVWSIEEKDVMELSLRTFRPMNEVLHHHIDLISPPLDKESPVSYADRIGRLHAAQQISSHSRELGQYFTPAPIARFLASLLDRPQENMRLLDAGAGVGILVCAAVEQYAATLDEGLVITVDACETDVAVLPLLHAVLDYAKAWAATHGIILHYNIIDQNFGEYGAQWENEAPNLFASNTAAMRYDAVITNPPYFKLSAGKGIIGLENHTNIYSLFLSLAARGLREGGCLVSITPRSFSSGRYFREFRRRFFSVMRPEQVHLFESRRQAFERDGVLQENIVMLTRHERGWATSNSDCIATISWSHGLEDLETLLYRHRPAHQLVNLNDPDAPLRLVSEAEEGIVSCVARWSGRLSSLGLAVSTGPVVAFRARDYINDKYDSVQSAPLLWMQNVRAMDIQWPDLSGRKALAIEISKATQALLIPNQTCVLMRRFSPKEALRRIVAAPLISGRFTPPVLGIENHLNYIHRPGGEMEEEEALGLAALLNSSLLDRYIRTTNGNTQVSATEMRTLPLPPLEVILKIGSLVRAAHDHDLEVMDDIVESVLRSYSLLKGA